MTVLVVAAIVIGSLLLWMVSVVIIVPVVLVLTYGRVELRTKSELSDLAIKEDPSTRHYPSLQEWKDSRGNKRSVSMGWQPRTVAWWAAVLAPLAFPLLPVFGLACVALLIVRWEADRLNGRLDIRRQVRKLVLAQEAEMQRLRDEARRELEAIS